MERAKLVESMNNVVLSLNDEDFLDRWYTVGVADSDTDYASYTDDKTFGDLMTAFCEIMRDALADGVSHTLYCDGIVS